MLNIIIKTVIIYVIVIFAMKLMGKKQNAQLQPYELVITLMIAEVAATPMDSPGTPIIYGLVPAFALILLYYLFSILTDKVSFIRRMLCGTPSILIRDGALVVSEIRRLHYSVSDLMEQLRIYGYTSISNIHFAILEANGQLSVLPYSEFAPATPCSLGVETHEDDLAFAIVINGQLQPRTLKDIRKSPEEVRKTLYDLGYKRIRDLLLVTLSDKGELFIEDMRGETKLARWGGK